MRKKLIYFHEADTAGNIYLPHEVDFKSEVYGTVNKFDCEKIPLDLVAVSGRVDFAADGIYLLLRIWNNPSGAKFAKMLESGYSLMPIGTGRIDEDNIVRDYVLHYFTLTIKPIWNVRDNLLKQHESPSHTHGRGNRADNEDRVDGRLPRNKRAR
jgi:hypothetical protein